MAETSSSQTVHAILLQEAQQEIASLRTDLYTTRRAAEERRQALAAQTTARDQLAAQVQQLEFSLEQCQSQLSVLHGVEIQLQTLREENGKLRKELEFSVNARKILQDELTDERKQRQLGEQAKAQLESDRSRIQKARDELAAQYRLAQKAAREAEEEQLHAEAEAAALKAEVEALRSQTVMYNGSNASSSAALSAHGESQLANGHGQSGGVSTAAVMEQLENERHRAAVLLDELHNAKAEIANLHQQLHAMHSTDSSSLNAQAEVAAARAQLNHAHDQIRMLEERVEATKAELAASKSAAEAMQQTHATTSHAAMQPSPDSHASTTDHTAGMQGKPLSRDGRDESCENLSALMSRLAASGLNDREAQLLAELERYQVQVTKLKQSRDKLLEEIDSQWEEMDRLAGEYRSGTEELQEQRRLAAAWEVQAQDALLHIDRLKGLLEESASWGTGTAPEPAQLQSQLLQEKARATEMELGMRALAAELVRAQHASVSIGRSVLPTLCGIEHRLGDMCGRATSSLQQWRQQRLAKREHAGDREARQQGVLALSSVPNAMVS